MAKFLSNPGPAEMPKTADVIIIGGGPAGTAALWAIERFAPGTRTVLIERSERLGAGSTTASLECFRTCWPSLCMAKQMERSVQVFQNADDEIGEGASASLGMHLQGYLFLGFNDRQAATLKAEVEHLHSMGLNHIESLKADEIALRFGWLGPRVVAAKYDPVAGWIDSNAMIYAFARAATNAQVLVGVPDVSVCVESGHVTGVSTPNGDISAPVVVIANGASAPATARTAGVELPVVMRPRQSFTTGWRHEAIPDSSPMLIGAAPFPHLHPEARSGAIFGWEYAWRSKNVDEAYGINEAGDALRNPVFPVAPLKDPRFPSIVLTLLARQFGHADGEGFADSRYYRNISHNIGYYVYRDETTAYREVDGARRPYESERAIIDGHPAVDGLFLSVAHVGHGIMTAPAAGEILASRVLGRPFAEPSFADFGLDVPWVAHDENAL